MDAPKLPLALTGLEVVYLTDGIDNDDLAEGLPGRETYVPVAREALLLLGSAYREVVAPTGILPGPLTLYVTQEQAWLFRSKVKTGDVAIDKSNIGIGLLLKLYELLLEFNADLGDVRVAPVRDRELDEQDKQFLQYISPPAITQVVEKEQEQVDAAGITSQDPRPNEGARAEPGERAPDGPGAAVPGPEGEGYQNYFA
jgi:hypothetical protein